MLDLANIEEARSNPAFGPEVWLTFYLFGKPKRLKAMALSLEPLGATNLDSSETGVIYAKVPVLLEEPEIVARVKQVRDLADAQDVGIDIIDLDSASDVFESTFYSLWQAP